MDNEELRTAVRLFMSDRNECEREYGDISAWDTSKVTDMTGLFAEEWDFNGNISA